MIRLNLGSNIIAVTLTEKTTISNHIYLFEFINNQSQKKYYCIATDTSNYKERYNKFTIVVKSSPNALNGEINLTIGDEYNYNVYAQTSTTNLNPTLADEKVETGLMTYDKDETIRAEFKPNQTRAVFNG